MRLFGRRRFLEASVATVCVGCASTDAPTLRAPSTGAPTAGSSDDGAADGGPLPVLGAAVEVGPLEEVLADTAEMPLYVPEAKAWVVSLTDDEAATVAAVADTALLPGLEHGLLALYEKCPHLGCRVPFCTSSGWFECMCHGAHFTPAGEHRSGPGPRGLDALAVAIDGGVVSIGQAERVEGAPVGTVVLDQPPIGPHCIGDGDD